MQNLHFHLATNCIDCFCQNITRFVLSQDILQIHLSGFQLTKGFFKYIMLGLVRATFNSLRVTKVGQAEQIDSDPYRPSKEENGGGGVCSG